VVASGGGLASLVPFKVGSRKVYNYSTNEISDAIWRGKFHPVSWRGIERRGGSEGTSCPLRVGGFLQFGTEGSESAVPPLASGGTSSEFPLGGTIGFVSELASFTKSYAPPSAGPSFVETSDGLTQNTESFIMIRCSLQVQKFKQLILHSSPLALGVILSYFFWNSNLLLLLIYSALVAAIIFSGRDRKPEFLIFIYGAIIGFAIETIGTQISGYQKFTNLDVWGIPYWLIVSWGYGFILMKRVGFILAAGSPWIQRK